MGRGGTAVRRTKVLAGCVDARLLAVVAPSGYGKTTFVDQWCGDRPALRVDLTEEDRTAGRVVARLLQLASQDTSLAAVPAAAGADDPRVRLRQLATAVARALPARAVLVLDDVHHLDPAASADVLDGLAALPAERDDLALALVGRHLPDTALAAHPSHVRIDAAALTFDRDEVAALVGDVDAGRCRRATDGWPAAVALWAEHSDGLAARAPERVLDALVTHLVAPLGSEALGTLRDVPLLDDEIGRLTGWPTVIADLARLGVPTRRHGGFVTVADVVRDRLPAGAPVAGAAITAVARRYAGAGDVLAGIDLLLGRGYVDATAELLAEVSPELLTQLDLHELRGVLESIPSSTPAMPGALLVLARAAGSRILRTLRAELLDRIERLDLDERTRAVVEVERVWDLAQNVQPAEAERRGFPALAAVDEHPVARARCLYALGQSFSMHEDEASFDRAAAYFAQCAGVARGAGLHSLRAAALSALSYRIHLRRGQFDLAWARAEEALSLVPRGTTQYGALLSFAAEVLDLLARDDDALDALAEARAVGLAHADARTIAYASWNMAKVHARRRRPAAVLACLRDADAHHGDWFDHPTGAEFLATGAQALATAGDVTRAREWLERTLQHPALDEYPDIAWPAQGAIALAEGDAGAAEEILQRLLDEGYTEPVWRWQYRLWIAWARHRRGDDAGARELVGTIQREVAAFGHPELPERVEPERWHTLLALASDPDLPAAGGEPAPIPTSIRLLGQFAVRHGDIEVTLPPGKPEALVKLLALSGRPLPADEVTDALWDDAPTDVGMRRLRNVLSRVNGSVPLVVREGATLALTPGTAVDAVQFEAAAQLALRTGGPDRGQRVAEALARYHGELLPADRFVEHTVLARERIRSLAVRLDEALADELARAGDVDGAVVAIEHLLGIDPYDDASADRAAELLAAAGRTASARAWAERAARIRADLGAG